MLAVDCRSCVIGRLESDDKMASRETGADLSLSLREGFLSFWMDSVMTSLHVVMADRF